MHQRLIVLLLCLLTASALAEPLSLTDDLMGDECYPAGATPETAHFVYHYQYPQIAGDDEVAQLINNVYETIRGEVVDFTAPILFDELTLPSRSSITVSYTITCNSDDYFSVFFATKNDLDGYAFTVYSAQVFSRHGGKAGQATALPYLLGILTPGETDTWLQERQTAKADACIRRMILDSPNLPSSIDQDYLDYAFYPEEDFYMDAAGALVFFLQPDDDHPLLIFPFTLDEILDEL